MRRTLVLLGLGLTVLGIAGAALWAALPRLIETQAVSRLTAMGLSPVHLTVRAVSPTRMVIDDIQVSQAVRARRVSADLDLLSLSIESLTVEGLEITVDLRDGTPRIGGLERLAGLSESAPQEGDGGDTSEGLPTLPISIRHLSLPDLRVGMKTAEDRYTASGDLRATLTGATPTITGTLAAEGGGLNLTARLDTAWRGALPWGVDGMAEITLRARNGVLPGLAQGLDGALDITARRVDRALEVTVAPDAHLDVKALAPGLLAALPPTADEALPLPWHIAVSALREKHAPTFRVTPKDAGRVTPEDAGTSVRLAASGQATLDTAGGRIALSGDGRVTLQDGHAISDMDVSSLAVEATNLTMDGTTWSAFASLGDLTGAPLTAKAARSRLVLEVKNLALPGIVAPRGSLSLSGPLTWSGFALLFGVEDGLIDMDGPSILGPVALPQGLEWPLRASGPQTSGLEIAIAPDGAVTLVPHLRVDAPHATVEIAGQAVRAAFDDGTIDGVVPLPDTPAMSLKTHLRNGTLDAAGLHAQAIEASLAATPAESTLSLSAQVTRLPGEADPLPRDAQAVRPFHLTSHAQTGGDRTEISFSALLQDAQDRPMLRAEGHHDLGTGRGRAAIAVPKRTYGPDGPRPDQYFTPLGQGGLRLSGVLGANGTVSWSAAGLAPQIDLLLQDAVVTRGFLTLDRVNGVIRLDRFWPPRTPPGQTLAVAAMDAGLPLTDGLASFRLDGAGGIVLDHLTFSLAGGTLEASDTTVPLDASRGTLTLSVSGMDLARLIGLIDLPGLDATGTLDGTIPVRLRDGNVIVDQGRLSTRAPGLIRYRPDTPPAALASGGQSTELLLRALGNFQYQGLSLTVDGSAAGEMQVALHLSGANPELYDGYPIEFNLTVGGALSQVITDSLRGYQVPDRIRQRIQSFGH